MKKNILSIILILSVLLQSTAVVFAEEITEETTEFGTGLADMSDERWAEFNAKLPLIVDVKPNEIALSRVESTEVQTFSTSNEEITAEQIGNEVSYVYPGETSAGGMTASEFPLTSAVDVSQSLTFPPIGNQGSINSCVAWSLGYYQLTNNNCVARGTTAKTSSGAAVNANIMSPRFIYPLVNGGKNVGTYYDEACAAIMSYGCPNVTTYSSNITTSNLDEWCTDTSVWNSAIYNKPHQISYEYQNLTEPVTADTPFVVNIKRLLSNGYVVTIPTFVNSFVYTTRTTTGAYGCRYMSSSKLGGHAMTVVGYDDDFWVDVNNNNSQDSGEIGAFKIANSWGTSASYYTNGYVWMPYDAVGSVSGVSNAPTSRAAAFNWYYFIEPEKEYTPLLVANVEMTTQRRNQVAVKVGISDTDTTTPDELISVVNYYNIAFNNASQSWIADDTTMLDRNFTGGTTSQTVTIPFDLTPVIKKAYDTTGFTEKTNKRLYVEVTDAVSNSYNITLGDVTIIEPITGKTVASSNTSDLVASDSSVTKTVDFEITPFVGFDENQDITLVFNSNVQASTIANNIYFSKDDTIIYPEYDVIDNRVIVYPPTNGYTADTDYELHISTGVKSMGGNSMQSEKVVLLYMLDEYYVYW